jgi:hypothetical protein
MTAQDYALAHAEAEIDDFVQSAVKAENCTEEEVSEVTKLVVTLKLAMQSHLWPNILIHGIEPTRKVAAIALATLLKTVQVGRALNNQPERK